MMSRVARFNRDDIAPPWRTRRSAFASVDALGRFPPVGHGLLVDRRSAVADRHVERFGLLGQPLDGIDRQPHQFVERQPAFV